MKKICIKFEVMTIKIANNLLKSSMLSVQLKIILISDFKLS